MDKSKADSIITEYLPKIYGFAIKKAFSYDEAEDLCGDIVQEVYLALLRAGEIHNLEGYIWRISVHVHAKYVAFKKKHLGVSIDGMDFPFYDNYDSIFENAWEETARLRREIAYLSKTRREIVYLFYYENWSISSISEKLAMPEGTVKWHLNKARNELKEGFTMERKKGTLGMSPITALSFGHSGIPNPDQSDTEYYLQDKLNLNIVYSVYHEPRSLKEISEELGVTPVFLEDRVEFLEANGFLVRAAGNRFTTYVDFTPRTYSREQQDAGMKVQQDAAKILAKEYVPLVRRAMAEMKDVYLPGGNRELLDAAAIFQGVCLSFQNSDQRDLSKYYVKTTAGGEFIPMVTLSSSPSDPEYKPVFDMNQYWSCGDMWRNSNKYPVGAWAVDTKFCSRQGGWQENHTSDYEYLYEFMNGTLIQNPSNAEKFERLRQRGYLTDDNRVNLIVVKEEGDKFFQKIPLVSQQLRGTLVQKALENATMKAKQYPPQMQDLIMNWEKNSIIGRPAAIMLLDILYQNGTLKLLTQREMAASQLIVFSDILP